MIYFLHILENLLNFVQHFGKDHDSLEKVLRVEDGDQKRRKENATTAETQLLEEGVGHSRSVPKRQLLCWE